jgi:hypothetical protein
MALEKRAIALLALTQIFVGALPFRDVCVGACEPVRTAALVAKGRSSGSDPTI